MNEQLPRRLKRLREKEGFLQKDVAKELGVRSNILSGYENGTRSPDPEMLVRLARLYNVSTDYLLGYSDDETEVEDPEFVDFIQNVQRWYKEAPKDRKEDLERLKKIFEAFKDE